MLTTFFCFLMFFIFFRVTGDENYFSLVVVFLFAVANIRQILEILRSNQVFIFFICAFALLTSSKLLSLEIANAKALLFACLNATFAFFLPKSFYFFSIAWLAMIGQKEMYCKYVLQYVSTTKIPQITCKAIFGNCQ